MSDFLDGVKDRSPGSPTKEEEAYVKKLAREYIVRQKGAVVGKKAVEYFSKRPNSYCEGKPIPRNPGSPAYCEGNSKYDDGYVEFDFFVDMLCEVDAEINMVNYIYFRYFFGKEADIRMLMAWDYQGYFVVSFVVTMSFDSFLAMKV